MAVRYLTCSRNFKFQEKCFWLSYLCIDFSDHTWPLTLISVANLSLIFVAFHLFLKTVVSAIYIRILSKKLGPMDLFSEVKYLISTPVCSYAHVVSSFLILNFV